MIRKAPYPNLLIYPVVVLTGLILLTGFASREDDGLSYEDSQALVIRRSAAGKPYFAYCGAPLLSFGGGAGHGMFWMNRDAFDALLLRQFWNSLTDYPNLEVLQHKQDTDNYRT